jgi:Niemann-Pick C1 protein
MATPKIQDIFLHAGYFYAKYPILTIIFTLLAVLLSGGGIIHLEITNDPIELWVDKSSQKYKQKEDMISIFGDDFRIENLIFKIRDENVDESKIDLIDPKYLKEISYFQTVILKSKVTVKSKEYSLNDICYRAFQDGACIVQSPMNYWQNNISRLEADKDIKATVSCFKSVDPLNSIACMDENKIPVVSEAVFGGIRKSSISKTSANCQQNSPIASEGDSQLPKNPLLRAPYMKQTGQIPSQPLTSDDPCGLYYLSATTLSLSVLLESDPDKTTIYEAFEKDVIESLILEFNENSTTEFFQKWIPDVEVEPLQTKINYMLQRTVNDELKKETSQNYIIVVISYLLMFLYVSLSLSKHWNRVGSSILLSLCGLLYIGLSVFTTYSVCGLFNIKANLISLEVIPFLILAIGVDNMFLIFNSVLKVPSEDINIKIPVGLRSVGLSILLSTFTQIATFMVGLYMDIPALRSFCAIAAIALFLNFMFQVTAFPALLALDLRRKKSGYLDLVPFVKAKGFSEEDKKAFILNDQKTNWTYRMFKNCWTPCTTSLPCKIITVIISLTLLGLCIPALINIPLGLDQQNTTIRNDNLYNYFGDLKNYIEIGPQSYIILKTDNWTNLDIYDNFDRLIDFLSQKKGLIASSFRVWYHSMLTLRDSPTNNKEMANVCFKGHDAQTLVQDVNKLTALYMTFTLEHPCCSAFSICGGQFYQDVIFDKNNNIKVSRITFFHQALRKQSDYIDSMNQIQDLVDYFLKNMMNDSSLSIEIDSDFSEDQIKEEQDQGIVKDSTSISFDAYPYSLFYVFFEQYSYVKGITIQNYILSLLFLFCFVSCLYSAFTSLILVFIVLLISSNLWSLMWIQNLIFSGLPIEFNAILVVNLIIAIGFSVEFCIHIIVRFKKAKGNKKMRVKVALNEIGSLVFQGIFITKLIGLSVLYFSKIPLFRLYYFQVYITMILICGFYGLVVTPIILELLTFQKFVNRRTITEYFNKQNNKVSDNFNPNKPEEFNKDNLQSPPPELKDEDVLESPPPEKKDESPNEKTHENDLMEPLK